MLLSCHSILIEPSISFSHFGCHILKMGTVFITAATIARVNIYAIFSESLKFNYLSLSLTFLKIFSAVAAKFFKSCKK